MADLPPRVDQPATDSSEPALEGGEATPEFVRSRYRMSAVSAAVLAAAIAIITALPLAAAWVYPGAFPLAAPLALAASAAAVWGGSLLQRARLRAELGRLSDENVHLAQNFGWLADTARELRESERALSEARAKAEAASQAKSRLLATVSHEFRTPLNGILGLTGLLLETEQTPDQQTYAQAVHSSGEALLALVDDMLDFSKIEAGRLDLQPEPTDITELLQGIAELLAARAFAKGIDIAADVAADLPAVLVDSHRLRQVLLNLAGNGVKFTEHGGVTLSARRVRTEDDQVEVAFSVADTGHGIAAEAVPRLFREFEQLEPVSTRRYGGAGLGLAISRRIALAMGGDVAVAARDGGGTVFSFSLTLPRAAVAGGPDRTPDIAGRSVLILAGGGAEPPVLAAALTAAGATARIAATPYEAAALMGAAAAAGQSYDAVLVDARNDATPALLRLRDASGVRTPAAVLIELGGRTDVDRFRNAGFDAYLVRPVRRTSLVRILADIIAGGGGEFRIDPGDTRSKPVAAPALASSSLSVLLAEDNEINALLSRAVLEGMGHRVEEVRDGAAAVTAATSGPRPFDVILMDLHMPGMDGLAAVRAIRAHETRTGAARTKILAVTADVLAETRAAALAAGADQVIEKPMTPGTLRRALAVLAAAA